MRRINVGAADRRNLDVFRIRSFQYEKAGRLQDPKGLFDQGLELRKGQMLGDVKA